VTLTTDIRKGVAFQYRYTLLKKVISYTRTNIPYCIELHIGESYEDEKKEFFTSRQGQLQIAWQHLMCPRHEQICHHLWTSHNSRRH